MKKKNPKSPSDVIDIEFDIVHLLRVLNMLEHSVLALLRNGKAAEIQNPIFRKILRDELAKVAQALMDLNAMAATERCVLIVEALVDRMGTLEFVKIDPLVLEFKKALVTDLGTMKFVKVT